MGGEERAGQADGQGSGMRPGEQGGRDEQELEQTYCDANVLDPAVGA